jgi:tetratricopeptide (TPR) repeat protein
MKRMLVLAWLAVALAPGGASAQDSTSVDIDSVWTEARRLSDAKQYDQALAVLSGALKGRPDDVSLLWLQAGVTGWAGHHREAVRLYESLLAAHPHVTDAIRVDLGREDLEIGQPANALELMDACLRVNPENVDAMRVRASALADLGRWDEAEAAFAAILAQKPGDVDARIGAAQVANWRGDHRRAAELFQTLIDDEVKTADVYNGLAYAQYWSGRSDLAVDPMKRSLALDPQDRTAGELSTRLRWEEGPWVSADYNSFDDSDELQVGTVRLEFHQPLSPRDVVTASWKRQETNGPPRDFDMAGIGAGYSRLWSTSWSSDAALEYQYEGAGEDAHMLGEANVTYRPSDVTRLDGGVAREQVLAGGALELDILDWIGTVGGDWRPSDRWLFTAALRRHWYSDDNTAWRTTLVGQYGWMRGQRFESAVNVRFEHLSAAENPGHGYYAPDSYYECTPGILATYTWPSRWSVGGEVRAGFQKENGASAEFLGGLSLRAEAPLARSIMVGAEGEVTDSNLATASGYSRNSWGIFVRGSF